MGFNVQNILHNKRMMNIIFVSLFMYGSLVLFLTINQRNFMYFPGKDRPNPVAAGLPSVEVIAVQPLNLKESIEGWYQAPSDPTKPVILYFHGNAGNIDIRADRVKHYIQAGYGVLLAEYRGYGGNPGKPTEKGLFGDSMAYYEWLIKKGEIPDNRIVVYGESLGTGPAVWLAGKFPGVRAVILESPYTSMTDIARRNFFFVPVDLLLFDRFNSMKRIHKVTAPVLVMQGMKDRIIPAKLSARLYDAVSQPKTLKSFETGGHNDLYDYGAPQVVLEFLASVKG